MDTLVILNPYARRGRGGRLLDSVASAFRAAGVKAEIATTDRPRAAEQLAAAAQGNGAQCVVAAGGDGTISEVVNGLLGGRAVCEAPPKLGIVPIGTGNDFADMLGLPRDVDSAVSVIARGASRLIDAATVNERFFDNNCALGMEAAVTLESSRIQHVKGNLRYVLALLKTLRRLESWRLRVDWAEGRFEGPAHLLSICNGPRCGGLFRMAPQAQFDDGLLDVVIAPQMSRLSVLALTPHFVSGGHVRDPRVIYVRTRALRIEIQPGAPVHADGEILAMSASELRVECLPGALRVLTP